MKKWQSDKEMLICFNFNNYNNTCSPNTPEKLFKIKKIMKIGKQFKNNHSSSQQPRAPSALKNASVTVFFLSIKNKNKNLIYKQ